MLLPPEPPITVVFATPHPSQRGWRQHQRSEGTESGPDLRSLWGHQFRQALRHSCVQRLFGILQAERAAEADLQVGLRAIPICWFNLICNLLVNIETPPPCCITHPENHAPNQSSNSIVSIFMFYYHKLDLMYKQTKITGVGRNLRG